MTLDGRFATLCGYTQGELESAFADHLAGVDLAEVKQWYNGYNFLGEPVYNPFDVLLYLDSREFRPWWFETGTPTFLINLLQTRRYNIPDLENLEAGEELLGTFDVDRIEPEALLFQTGYLTIRERYQRSGLYRYRLRYPNFEVRASLPTAILNAYVPNMQDRLRTEDRIYAALEADEPDGLYRGVPRLFRLHPSRLASAQRHRRLRRLLGLGGVLLLRRPWPGGHAGGCDQPWPHRPVHRLRRASLLAGIQGGGIQ